MPEYLESDGTAENEDQTGVDEDIDRGPLDDDTVDDKE